MFSKLSSGRSFDGVAREIRTLIQNGQLRDGDRLPAERDLAAQLGVGRGTVREALRGLENAGLVAMKNGVAGGAFMALVSASLFVFDGKDWRSAAFLTLMGILCAALTTFPLTKRYVVRWDASSISGPSRWFG